MQIADAVELYGKAHKLQGRTEFQGLSISIENAVGSVRRGVNKKTGKAWATKMKNDYGRILLTKGVDGDHVDVFLGPNKDAKFAYIVHQNDPDTGKYDEDKCFLGFDSATQAKAAYNAHYDEPEKFYGSMDTLPMDEFKKKVLATKDRPKVIKAKSVIVETTYQMFNVDMSTMLAGGPGSGCHGSNCGRKSSLSSKDQIALAKSQSKLSKYPIYDASTYKAYSSLDRPKNAEGYSLMRIRVADLVESDWSKNWNSTSKTAVKAYEKKIINGNYDPIVVAHTDVLDGTHRAVAAYKVGAEFILADIEPGIKVRR